MRPKTGILVNVIDLSPIEESFTQELRVCILQQHQIKSEMIGLKCPDVWGTVETSEGTYILNAFGVGPKTPLTTEQTTQLGFSLHEVFGESCVNMVPATVVPITRKLCKELPVSHTMPLEDFIVTHTENTESNFKYWMKKLKAIDMEDEESDEESYPDLAVYGSFLLNKVCTCKKDRELLVQVSSNGCPCGCQKPHRHCKVCGKVF